MSAAEKAGTTGAMPLQTKPTAPSTVPIPTPSVRGTPVDSDDAPDEGSPKPLADLRKNVLVPSERPARVLLVEDEQLDRECIRTAFESLSSPIELRAVEDGETAVDFLLRRGKHATRWAAWRPDIVLLDLALPSLSGFEVLREIRLNPGLDDLIVCVLTSSEDRETVRRLYRLGANSYLVKPSSVKGFRELAQRLQGFWFDIVQLPS